MVEFGTSSAFRGWVRVRVLGYGFGVRGKKVKSRDCALASDLVRATSLTSSAKRPEGRAALPGLPRGPLGVLPKAKRPCLALRPIQ